MLDPTRWYQFSMPEDEDLMSRPDIGITDNFEKILKAAKCDVVSDTLELPKTGYKVGDKIFAPASMNSIFVCIAEDPYWGNWWKPLQTPISQWQTVPDAVIQHADYEQHPTYPFQIAIDNKGRLYGRGAIRLKSGATMPNAVSQVIFRQMPDGIRPPCNTMSPTAIDPVTMANPTGLTALKSGRLYIRSNGTSSHRFFNPGSANTVWHTELRYQPGRDDFTTP